MNAFEPDWVFDLWCDGAADCRAAEELVDAGVWSPLRGKLVMMRGNFTMWLFGWWKHPRP